MPVPLTNACLVLAAILAVVGSDVGALVIGSAGVLNQAVVELAAGIGPHAGDSDGVG